MREIFKNNQSIDIYIDLDKTSYRDPETQQWLWDEAKVVYSGLNVSPIMFLEDKVTIGWEDDGHICFDSSCLTMSMLYFEILLRDGQKLIDNLYIQKILNFADKG